MPRRVRAYRIDPTGVGNLCFRDTTISPALGASLWEDCPLLPMVSDPAIGTILDENFLRVTPSSNAIPGWLTTLATSGAVTLDATKGLKIDAGAVTANQGVNLQLTSNRFAVAANKPVWFEARVRFENLATPNVQFLLGLAAIQTALISAGAVGTHDKIAFDGVTTTGAIASDCRASGTQTTGGGLTFANNTTYKLGFKATTTEVKFWVNGSVVATIATNIPSAALAPAIVVQANAVAQPNVFLERLRCVGIL